MKICLAHCLSLFALLCPLASASTQAATPPTSVPLALLASYDKNGLATLRYGDLTLTDTRVHEEDAFSLYDVGGAPLAKIWDAKSQTLIYKYGWGNLACQYTQTGNQLDLDISVANTSARAVGGFNIFPLGMHFQRYPRNFDSTTPYVRFNTDGPGVQSADFGSGIVTILNRDVQSPLCVGFVPGYETAKNFGYRVYVGSDHLWYQPNNWPTYPRPVAAGGRDKYQISLRFSPPGSDETQVAADINARYAAAHPMQLKWDDRRPIASLFLASAADQHPLNNPRGWFYNDASIDAHSAPGRARLRQRILSFADESIEELKSVGAQGAITWDIEGQQYPHSTSYIGDPRLTPQLAPEMDAIADEYFAKFRAAGMRVGVCVRPQLLQMKNGGAAQNEVAGIAEQLIDKIQYAKTRWGATLFYVDSNGGPYDPTDAQVFARVARAHPDVLLIPEHQNAAYYAYTAPYNQLGDDPDFTPAEVRQLYPDAFSVVKVMDGRFATRRAALLDAARRGDILMFNGWYDSPDGAAVREVTAQLGRGLRVTTLADVIDAGDGQTSLREAINTANTRTRGAEITFAPVVRGAIRLNSALPQVRGNCTVVGPDARLLILDGAGNGGIFKVARGARLTISGLTLRGGNAGSDSGFSGGAICSQGDLAARDCYFIGNSGNIGGAIYQLGGGVAALERCTLQGNLARNRGGAIFSESALFLTQCTVVDNAAPNQAGGGGAICAHDIDLTLESCTINGNRASGRGAGLWFSGGALKLHNSIIAGNGSADLRMESGALASGGYNLIGAATPQGNWAPSDKLGADARLAPPRFNGGPTPTCILLSGSAALNAGDPAIKSGADQRGMARVCNARVDIGALEMPVAVAPVAPISAIVGGSGGSA